MAAKIPKTLAWPALPLQGCMREEGKGSTLKAGEKGLKARCCAAERASAVTMAVVRMCAQTHAVWRQPRRITGL